MPLGRNLDFESLFDGDEGSDPSTEYEWVAFRGADGEEVNPAELLRHYPAEKTSDGYRVPFPGGFCEKCLAHPMVDESSGAIAWLCEHQCLIVALDVRQGEVAYLPWLQGRARFERAFTLASAEAQVIAAAATGVGSRRLH